MFHSVRLSFLLLRMIIILCVATQQSSYVYAGASCSKGAPVETCNLGDSPETNHRHFGTDEADQDMTTLNDLFRNNFDQIENQISPRNGHTFKSLVGNDVSDRVALKYAGKALREMFAPDFLDFLTDEELESYLEPYSGAFRSYSTALPDKTVWHIDDGLFTVIKQYEDIGSTYPGEIVTTMRPKDPYQLATPEGGNNFVNQPTNTDLGAELPRLVEHYPSNSISINLGQDIERFGGRATLHGTPPARVGENRWFWAVKIRAKPDFEERLRLAKYAHEVLDIETAKTFSMNLLKKNGNANYILNSELEAVRNDFIRSNRLELLKFSVRQSLNSWTEGIFNSVDSLKRALVKWGVPTC